MGGEWAQRVDAEADEDGALDAAAEVWREVRGLRERTVYEFWVRAATGAGAGAPSRPVTAAPAHARTCRYLRLGCCLLFICFAYGVTII